MAAICHTCNWTGGSTQVVDGGRCPECGARIRYEFTPLPERRRITSAQAFNQRAAVALRSVDFGSFNNSERVVAEFQRQHAAGSVSTKMQQAIINIAHRYRRQIHDSEVTEYALMHARGAD